jgi:hypothetical protein
MRALHKDSLTCWRELLGAEHFASLIRPVGQVRIWEGEGAESTIELAFAERHGTTDAAATHLSARGWRAGKHS